MRLLPAPGTGLPPLLAFALALALAAAGCSGGDGQTLDLATASSGATGTTSSASTGSGMGGAASSTSVTTGSLGAGGGGGAGGGSCTMGPPSTTYPAPHAKSPVVVNYGGPVLASPRIVPVFFANDDPSFTAQVVDFLQKVSTSAYWGATTAEYGVGPATVTAPVQAPDMPSGTIDDSAIQAWLAGKLESGDPAWPAPDGNTLYVLHYPDPVTITLTVGSVTDTTCQNIGGYHSELSLDPAHGSASVPYAVLPRCNQPGSNSIDTLTASESHELIEAATDPFIFTSPAYATIDLAHFYWAGSSQGSEVGDMCENDPTSYTNATDVPYNVQRTWSNAAALAGHDPCVPAPAGEVYFNSVPTAGEPVPVMYAGYAIIAKGVKIPVGQTRTVELALFSDGDTGGPWYVDALDVGALTGSGGILNLGLACSSGENGQTLQLSITVGAPGPGGYETYAVTSQLNQQQTVWLGIVGN